MSTSPIVVSENDVDDESSNVELNISSSSINTSSPKAGGYRKARCRYCTLSLSYAKIPLMYTHIANQCDAVVRINSAARLDTITKLSEFDQQSQSPKSVKRMIQINNAMPVFTELNQQVYQRLHQQLRNRITEKEQILHNRMKDPVTNPAILENKP
ncbi:unnamed protein product [Adineta steineri]|uniref:BED-type domain-containing protein n=1 Tax=Adineta steineri TaxID=433720 RepID=A0A815EVT2_9BILA|nr:unnamed protein product [Adineta steineri]